MKYALSVSTKRSVVVALVALAVVMNGQRAQAQAEGGLIWFTDQAAFEAFNAGDGKFHKGTEDFEESILPPISAFAFDDPLESGVANLPDGFPFPVGMTGLPNLIVQSNFEHNPGNPNPRGIDGLATLAINDPMGGDSVLTFFECDSFDLIFTDEKSGVGFSPLSFVGADVVEIRVYSTTNVFLGKMTSPADPNGFYFIGVWSPTPIGRINIFDIGNGFEGADNIQAWQESLCGDPSTGSCFVIHPTPFCNDAECCDIVCIVDPFCCDKEWDGLCVGEAQELCAGCGDPDAGSCLENNGTPGCDDAKCCAIVCDTDPFCCASFWDQVCADEAAVLCGQPPKNDLCDNAIAIMVPNSVFGFTDLATVDNTFPICDGVTITAPGLWYSVIGTGTTMTATTCADLTTYNTKISVYCNGCIDPICVGGNDDDCDLFAGPSTVIWCSQESTEYLILVHGSGKATGGFTLSVFEDGAACAPPDGCVDSPCGAGAGNCYESNGTPGCNNTECCEAVCIVDPFCCDTLWDGACAQEAAELCGNCGDAAAGDCCDPAGNATTGCDDLDCCQAVCAIDPFCCDTLWDGQCALEAAELCDVCNGGICGPDSGDCCDAAGNGTPGCNDTICCETVCAVDPFCCDNLWDGQCANEAVDLCPICPPPSKLIWFNNQADFEAFNSSEGKVLKGIEDFEESILGPNAIDFFDDSLESNVPNLPDGFPFPNGMTGLPNLRVQSNFEHDPANENPHGRNALGALSAGFLDVVSDVVIANFLFDSLDLIFIGEKSGVGFDAITIKASGTSVEVRVYSTTNVFLGMMPTPSDPAGTNFIGVSSPTPIGRINIFDPSTGFEGGDNIQTWGEPDPCPWDLDGSGAVGTNDLLALFAQWGQVDTSADFDGGGVSTSDLLILFANWGLCP